MATSNIQGGDHAATRPDGTDVESLGPSDSSDGGSDVQNVSRTLALEDDAEGAWPLVPGTDSDRSGTGERAAADGDVDDGADILPDRVIGGDPDSADTAVPDMGELAQDDDDDDED